MWYITIKRNQLHSNSRLGIPSSERAQLSDNIFMRTFRNELDEIFFIDTLKCSSEAEVAKTAEISLYVSVCIRIPYTYGLYCFSERISHSLTHEQRWLLPGCSVVTTQKHVDTLFMPTLEPEADNKNVLYIFLAMMLVSFQITTRPRLELWLTVCEPCQTITPQHAYRSVPESENWK